MNKFFIFLFNVILAIPSYGQTESDATAIAKLNLEMSHIEMEADSMQVNGIMKMLIDQKQKSKNAGKIDKIKYEYLIKIVNQRYAGDVGFHISDVTSYGELNSLRDLIISRRRLSILKKYKKLSIDYVDSKYKIY